MTAADETAGGGVSPEALPSAPAISSAPLDNSRAEADGGIVTVVCQAVDCAEEFTGPKFGRGNAYWHRGVHMKRAHGMSQTGIPRRPKAKAQLVDVDVTPAAGVLEAARSVADAAGAGRKGVPTADDLAAGAGRALGLATMFAASVIVETDPNIPPGPAGDETRQALIGYLTLTQKSAAGVMRPIARMMAPTKLNRQYGRHVVDNVDAIGSLFDIGQLILHYRRYFAMRHLPAAGPTALPQSAAAIATPPGMPLAQMGPPTPNGAPTAEQNGILTSPPPLNGHVATPADIEALMRGIPPQ